ncbi:helix-turn-helix transcriptional regulator [Lysobacter panacisoli]|uniref:HTH araC/xylS-type domain-containing protein n=1 Tax=Lysobacter panacisoli TaxID=1255263 RepID=A0ABP9L9K0_9GAMM|nr:helix-turn-helix transcriptional regulator [Lysobacter panacisoli]
MSLHFLVMNDASAPPEIPWPAAHWHLVRGSGAHVLPLPADWPSLWLVLDGNVTLHAQDAQWSLRAGEAQLWRAGALRARTSADAQWWCLAGPLPEWNRRFASTPDEEPLPWHRDADDALPRALECLAADETGAEDALVALLANAQRDVAAHLPRCRGRTLRHRRQTLLRLLYLHHLMRCHVEADDDTTIDVAWLAERAHYSPGHLIRLHRDVFGETPGEHVSRLRDERAWQLVRGTDLPVVAITHKLGFESQSAFCRAFKHAFGMTATQARRLEDSPCAA